MREADRGEERGGYGRGGEGMGVEIYRERQRGPERIGEMQI